MNGAFASIVGFGLMVAMGYLWYRRKLLLRDGVRATGTISGVVWKKSDTDNADHPWFTIDFTDGDGAGHQVSTLKGGGIRHMGEGDKLELVYPAGKPEKAVLAGSDGGGWMIGAFILGLVFFIAPFFD